MSHLRSRPVSGLHETPDGRIWIAGEPLDSHLLERRDEAGSGWTRDLQRGRRSGRAGGSWRWSSRSSYSWRMSQSTIGLPACWSSSGSVPTSSPTCTPTGGLDLKLAADTNRQVFLVFKEAVNNAVRHSGCGRVEIELAVEGERLSLVVRDDACGFQSHGKDGATGSRACATARRSSAAS